MRAGFRSGLIIETCYGVFVFLVCFLFAKPLMSIFTGDPEVTAHGVKDLHLISFMYLLPAWTNGIQGSFRGIGDLKITLISSFVNMGFRVIAAFPMILIAKMGIEALPYSYLYGWVAMLAVELPLLIRSYKVFTECKFEF